MGYASRYIWGGPKYFRNLNLPHKRDTVQGSATRYGEPTIFWTSLPSDIALRASCQILQHFFISVCKRVWWFLFKAEPTDLNTLRTGDADLRLYIKTVQNGWRKFAFLTRACFPCTVHLIMQYTEPVSEWSCWRMFIENWPHSELTFRHRASSI